MPNELISERLDRRFPDMLLLADCHGGTPRVLIHLEPVTDPRPRERIARQLRFVLGSMYDHPLLKEPSPMATMLEVFTEARDAERVRDRREGRLEGQARTIVRQATQRFGDRTARCLSRLLAGVTDPERMDGIAEAVIDSGAGGEFLARVEAVLEADRN